MVYIFKFDIKKLGYDNKNYVKTSQKGRSVCINPRDMSCVMQYITNIEKVSNTPKLLDNKQT